MTLKIITNAQRSDNNRILYDILRRADLRPKTRDQYLRELQKMIDAGVDPTDSRALQDYADSLAERSKSSPAFLRSALMIVYTEIERRLKAGADPANLAKTQAALLNIEAMRTVIRIHRPKGQKTATWLTTDEAEALTALPDRNTMTGRRDWLLLSYLLHGLRRAEAVELTPECLKLIPGNNGKIPIMQIEGKGGKFRSVPMEARVYDLTAEWMRETGAGDRDRILRSFYPGGQKIRTSMSDRAVNDIVRQYGAAIGIPELEPHDLRRTFAMIIWNNTLDLMRLSALLGHANPQTTKKYLNLSLDTSRDITQFIPISGD